MVRLHIWHWAWGVPYCMAGLLIQVLVTAVSLLDQHKQELCHTALVYDVHHKKVLRKKEIGKMARGVCQAFRLRTRPEEPLCALKMRVGADHGEEGAMPHRD
jgi:hypothetical protein